MSIQAVNSVVTNPVSKKSFAPQTPLDWRKSVDKYASNEDYTSAELQKAPKASKAPKYSSIDEKQNDNVLMELDYIGNQLKAMLDLKAGKNVKVEKFANKLPEDEYKTNAQKQKDEAIVSLGYIGDVLHKLSEVGAGKEVESAEKKSTKGMSR